MTNCIASEIEALKKRAQKLPSVRQGYREFTKGKHGKRIIFLHSLKNGGVLLPCEGDLEYRNCLSMEFDKTIESYWLQPFQISLSNRKYTPDVYLEYQNGIKAFREVKPVGKLEAPEVEDLLRDATNFFGANGYSYEVMTEKSLPDGINLANMTFVYNCLPSSPSTSALLLAKKLFSDLKKPALVADFRQLLGEKNLDSGLIEFLIFSGHISIDNDSLFSELSLLRDCSC
jgi:hypothetical protein